MQDRIETLEEITRVEIGGALDREIQINIDMYKMKAAGLTFMEVEQAVSFNNMTVSGGNIDLQGMSRSIRVVGEVVTGGQVRGGVRGRSRGVPRLVEHAPAQGERKLVVRPHSSAVVAVEVEPAVLLICHQHVALDPTRTPLDDHLRRRSMRRCKVMGLTPRLAATEATSSPLSILSNASENMTLVTLGLYNPGAGTPRPVSP